MFFVKVAFWVILILLLLPSNAKEKFEFYATAQRSISDISSFCTRNAEICDKTTAAYESIQQKFVTTTEMIEEALRGIGFGSNDEQNTGDPAAQQPQPQMHQRRGELNGQRPSTTSSFSQDTLTAEDLRPRWNGPGSQSRVAYRE